MKRITLWVRFCTELKQTVLNSWYIKTMGVCRVAKTGIFSSLEIGTKNQNFLENMTSAAQFRLIYIFILQWLFISRYNKSNCTMQDLWKKFYQGYKNQYRAPYLLGTLWNLYSLFVYSNQNIDKTATMLRVSNTATSPAVKGSDHQFWAWLWLEKTLREYFYPPGPEYDVPLATPLVDPSMYAQDPGSLFWCHAVVSLQFTHGRSFALGAAT